MLKNQSQFLQELARICKKQDTNGNYDWDDTTQPTRTQVIIFLNDAIRETVAEFDYTFLNTTRAYAFQHVISGVQSVWLSGTSTAGSLPISGTVTPYPESVLNYSWTQDLDPNLIANNLSGIAFTGWNGTTQLAGVSISGYVTTNNWSGVGFNYQLDPDIDKIIHVMIPNSTNGNTSRGIRLAPTDYPSLEIAIPTGYTVASGTPVSYAEMPGLSPSNNKSIVMFPNPINIFSGQSFVVDYKKQHVDMVDDSSIQNVLPEKFQNLALFAAAQKIFDMQGDSQSTVYEARKREMMNQMKRSDFNNLDAQRKWKNVEHTDAANRMYITTPLFWFED